MPLRATILRREWFGGLLVENTTGAHTVLPPAEYEPKLRQLLRLRAEGAAVTLFDAADLGYAHRRDALASPTSLYIEVTKRCNGSCTHCYARAGPRDGDDELALADIERVIRDFADIGGCYVRLTGGEPTVRDDILDIIDAICERGLVAALNTNGFIDEALLQAILLRDVKDVRVSIDGTEAINDLIRGKGAYQSALRSVRSIAEFNSRARDPVDLTLNVVLMNATKGAVGAMIETAVGYGAKVSFGLLRLSGRARRAEMLSPADIVSVARTIQQERERLHLPSGQVRTNFDVFCDIPAHTDPMPFPLDNSRCPIGVTGMGVDACGRVVACGYLINVDGGRWLGEDVRKSNLLALWQHSDVLNEARRVTRAGCSGCPHHISRCNGGCPMMAYVFDGNLDGRDPYCVRDVPIGDQADRDANASATRGCG